MTEAEWLACTDPAPMLEFLRGKATERKLRLFACACCRRIWDLLDKESRTAVQVAERDADGISEIGIWAVAEMEERLKGRRASQPLLIELPKWWTVVTTLLSGKTDWVQRLLTRLAGSVYANANDNQAALRATPGDEVRAARAARLAAQAAVGQEHTSRCHLLRDIVGNPFRPLVLNAGGATPTVVTLAKTISDQQAFDRMPGLADALTEAGCTDPDLLGHLRGPGPHVRGCFAVDALLGKK